MHRRSAIASFALLASVSPLSATAASATASFNDILIRVYDLNPADGVDASVTWQVAENVLQVSGNNVDLAQTFSASQILPGFLTPSTRSGSSTSVSATSVITETSVSTSVSADAARNSFKGFTSTGHSSSFAGVLAPYSQFVFSATGVVTAQAHAHCEFGFFNCSYADARVYFEASGITSRQAYVVVSGGAPVGNPAPGAPIGATDSTPFSYFASNPTPNPVNFQFLLRAEVNGYESYAVPVPEPSTYLLWLLGGAVLALRGGKSARR